MAKKIKGETKNKPHRIKVTSKSYPKVDLEGMAKALGANSVYKIDWHGNSGYCFPDPGTEESVECGVCGAQMSVKRNVMSATGLAESLASSKHLHDQFTCSNVNENWHKRICRLKMDVYLEELDQDDPIGYEKTKEAAEKEILELLKANLK